MKNYTYITLLFLIIFFPLQAQDILAVKTTWYSQSVSDSSQNSTFPLKSSFVVEPHAGIHWVQNDGALTYYFSITQANGQWNDVSKPGEVEFLVQTNDGIGSVTFVRNMNDVKIDFFFPEGGVNRMPFTFKVQNIQSQ